MKELGNVAIQLSKNPLGILALAFVFVYGMACMVIQSDDLDSKTTLIMVYFLVGFPVLVFCCFMILVIFFHEKLYAPSDYKDEHIFAKTFLPQESQQILQQVEESPDDEESIFRLIDILLDEPIKQHLIFLSDNNLPIDVDPNVRGSQISDDSFSPLYVSHYYRFISQDRDVVSSGNFHPWSFTHKLQGTDLLQNNQHTIRLSEQGRRFVDWLRNNNKDARSFWTSTNQGWGNPDDIDQGMNAILGRSVESD